jgi:ribosome-binding ATPase
LKLAIIGLANSGKTTVFNALTKGNAETAAYTSASFEPNVAVVKVPDPRLEVLARMFKSKRIVPADIEYTDVVGVSRGSAQNETWNKQFINYISTADALVHVLRAFPDESVPHPEGSMDPARDVELVDMELALSDLAIVQKRLDRLTESIKKSPKAEREHLEKEVPVLERLQEQLRNGVPVRETDLSDDEEKMLRGYQFLTAKPMLVLINVNETQLPQEKELIEKVRGVARFKKTEVKVIAGKAEMELSQLDDEDAAIFREELGVVESAVDEVIQESYRLVNLISFFTTGPDESRAWTIKKGTPVQMAAGEIHTDLERGFIRAEVVPYEDLVADGSMVEAKNKGHLRLEGKGYIVKDGDVIEVLFSI